MIYMKEVNGFWFIADGSTVKVEVRPPRNSSGGKEDGMMKRMVLLAAAILAVLTAVPLFAAAAAENFEWPKAGFVTGSRVNLRNGPPHRRRLWDGSATTTKQGNSW